MLHIHPVFAKFFVYFIIFQFCNLKQTELSQRVMGHSSKPFKHWTFKNLRAFFERFARSRKLNPFLPETWYSISRKQVSDVKVFTSSLSSPLFLLHVIIYKLKREENQCLADSEADLRKHCLPSFQILAWMNPNLTFFLVC
jgi:hypothetical protein